MAIGGAVFDVSEFLHLHIGGPHIIRNHVGLDATAAYRKVLHHAHSEIDAQLAMYQIGHLRGLHFGARWGVVLTEDGLHALPLEDLFRTWVRFVYLLAGMENALNADYGFTTIGRHPGRGCPGADALQGAVRHRGAPAVPGQLPRRPGTRRPAHPVAAHRRLLRPAPGHPVLRHRPCRHAWRARMPPWSAVPSPRSRNCCSPGTTSSGSRRCAASTRTSTSSCCAT